MRITLCAEFYRTPEQGMDPEDYMVDGMKVLHLNMDDTIMNNHEERDKIFQSMLTTFVEGIRNNSIAQTNFPKFTALVKSEKPFWFHVTTTEGLDKRPKEFHTNHFSESELLGVPVEEEVSILYSSAGIRLDGHPDKFMLNIGAV